MASGGLWSAGWLLGFCGVCFFSSFVGSSFYPKKPLNECPHPIYLQLDLSCLFVPIAALAMVPTPFGMPSGKPWYMVMCVLIPAVTCFMAYTFSTKWDNIIANAGVWSYDKDCMVGTKGALPDEEYAWFLLHTCLGQMVLARMWAYREGEKLPARPTVPTRCKDWRIFAGMFLLLGCVPIGFMLLKHHSTLYLGVLLTFMPPVLAFQWMMFGHFFMWQPTYVWVPIVLESGYTIVLDSFAISRHIWTIYPASGIRIPINLFGNNGIQLEEILVYSLTSALVVLTLHPMLLITKAYYQWNVQRSFPSFMFSMIWHDGMPLESPDHVDILALPLHSASVISLEPTCPARDVFQLPLATLASAPEVAFCQVTSISGPTTAVVGALPQASQTAPPPVPQVSLERAVQLENEGVSLEQQGYNREAHEKYTHSMKFFEYVQKRTENSRVKAMIQERINLVASRACRLQLIVTP